MLEEILKQLKENELDSELLSGFLKGYLEEEVSDSEAERFLKAFSEVTQPRLIKTFIEAIAGTGVILNWPENARPVIDKHSTGGVGDKVSLIVVPWIAACGFKVAKLSGRALGHTGGTIDKLESIPGVSTSVDSERFIELVLKNNCLIAEPSRDVCPVESKIYELRNRTGLIPYLPLVVSSVLSKKIATNADILVFDVKTGKGAFFKEREDSQRLAEMLVEVSRLFSKKAAAVITSMDVPLGRAVGNALEVREAIDFLSGKNIPGLNEVVYEIAMRAITLAGYDEEEAFIQLEAARNSGKALNAFVRMVRSLGGPETVDELMLKLPRAPVVGTLTCTERGYVHSIDPMLVSRAVSAASKGKKLPHTGIYLLAKVGDEVSVGSELCEIHAVDSEALDEAVEILENAFLIVDAKPKPLKFVIDRIY